MSTTTVLPVNPSAPIFDRKARPAEKQTEMRVRYGKEEMVIRDTPTAEDFSDRKQMWCCAGCGHIRVYGLEVPIDVIDRSSKQLNCAGCMRVTEHLFSHLGRGR